MVLRYLDEKTLRKAELTPEQKEEIVRKVLARVTSSFDPRVLLSPSEEEAEQIRESIRHHTAEVLRQIEGGVEYSIEQDLARRVQDLILGYGFLENLLPPRRTDLSEIAINDDGTVWVMKKGSIEWERVDVAASPEEIEVIVGKILGPLARRVSEAEPHVHAFIPPSPRMPAGARVQVVTKPLAFRGSTMINIRLFEPTPVKPEKLLEWGAVNEEVLGDLKEGIRTHYRVMVAGGTATGKTTTMCGLGDFIPKDERLGIVEDVPEVWIEHPNQFRLVARPPNVEGKYGVSIADLVTVCLRLSPRWITVGEIRLPGAAKALLRAQMSDHAGMSTIHADSPEALLSTLMLLLSMDPEFGNAPVWALQEMIGRAVDVVVQVGFDQWGKRRVMRVTQVGYMGEEDRAKSRIPLKDVFLYDFEHSTRDRPVWRRVGEFDKVRR